MGTKKNTGEYYLAQFLKIAPLSHALWRSCEALAFESAKFKKPILDIGCGFGEFAGIAFNKLEVGIDVNEDDLKKALISKKYRQLLKADARNLPFKNSTFSTVVSVSVLEHITEVEKVIKEANRILKKDGLLIFSVPTISMYNHLLFPKICKSIGLEKLGLFYFNLHCKAFKHYSLKTAAWWSKKLKSNGFEIIHKQGTISPKVLKLHEVFLITAIPSQLYKYLFGKRLLMTTRLRAKILPPIFGKYVKPDTSSDINMFFIAKKR